MVGAVSNGVHTGGPWQLPRAPTSPPGSEILYQGQSKYDIPSEDGQHISIDVYQQTLSPQMNYLAKECVSVCVCGCERNIFLKSQHLAGVLNKIADKSHERPVELDAMARWINQRLGP